MKLAILWRITRSGRERETRTIDFLVYGRRFTTTPLFESPKDFLLAGRSFFATVGAAGSVATVIRTAPALFVFCLIQIGTHLGIILSVGSLLSFSRRDILLASNANVGGATPLPFKLPSVFLTDTCSGGQCRAAQSR